MGGKCKMLQVGQAVDVAHQETGFQLTIRPAGPGALQVIALGVDFVVLEDMDGAVRTRIPEHLIVAVTQLAETVQAA